MNSFGRLFRISVYGESHGQSVGVVIDGCPAGIPLSEKDFEKDLMERRSGARGTSTRREPDKPIIMSGLFRGRTTGAPLTVHFRNTDVDSKTYKSVRDIPRPGHADYVAVKKYGGFNDHRGGGHFSGRMTLGLVASGVVAKKLILPMKVRAHLVEAGGDANIAQAVECALSSEDSIGGIIECIVIDVLPKLGEPFFDSVESLVSHAMFSVPGVKGIEFGAGFASARMRGSEYNDPIISARGKTKTNNCGGINGGITNGNDLLLRVAVRPPSSIGAIQHTYDFVKKKRVRVSIPGRHDACIALRMPVIVESVVSVVLADLCLLDQQLSRVTR
ncbi:MAG: chorismate synthase [Pseudomonadota bacterium]